jgi:hypothetical protein
MRELRAGQEDRKSRLDAIREKERKARIAKGMGAFRGPETVYKRVKTGKEGKDGKEGKEEEHIGDEAFLPEDKGEKEEEGVFLSKEVRDLMAK